MINPLLITRKENAGILRRICSELNAVPREMIGEDWSLAVFLKRDLKTYLYQSHFIFDLSAFKEQGDEFVNLCAGIYYQKSDANIVIYADNCYPGDEILDKLVHNGITNIVANYPDVDEKTNISMMVQDLKECITEGISQKKWRRFDKSFDAFAEAREATRKTLNKTKSTRSNERTHGSDFVTLRFIQRVPVIAEKEKEKPRYSQSNISIAVVGAQGRIGATTFAMRLAAYFKSHDGESLVVCANKRGFPQLEMMSEYYGGTEQNGIYTINGIDICTALTESEKQYNVQIYDYGSLPTSELKLDSFDKVFLIGGTSWNELPMIYMAQQPLNSVNYTVAVNFSDKAAVEKNKEFLMLNLNEVIVLPFEPDPFAVERYEDMFDMEFSVIVP